MATTIVDRDKGYTRLIARAKQLKFTPVKLRVGVIHGEEQHEDAPNKTVGEIAAIHELGLGNVPARPWLRPTIDGLEPAIRERIQRIAEAALMGQVTPNQGFSLLGLWLVSKIRARIIAGIPPALAESTRARKRNTAGQAKDTPLINTSQFLGAIDFAVSGGNARITKAQRSRARRAKKIKALGKSVSRGVKKATKQLSRQAKRAARSVEKATSRAGRSAKKSLKDTRRSALRATKRAVKAVKKAVRKKRRSR